MRRKKERKMDLFFIKKLNNHLILCLDGKELICERY